MNLKLDIASAEVWESKPILCLKDGQLLQLFVRRNDFVREWRPVLSFEAASVLYDCSIVAGGCGEGNDG